MINKSCIGLIFLILLLGVVSCGEGVNYEDSGGNSVFIFEGGYARGDAGFGTYENMCKAAHAKLAPTFAHANVRPFMSSAKNGNIRDLIPANSGLIVRSLLNNSVRIANVWDELWDNTTPLINPISIENKLWYSGSNELGALVANAGCGNGNWNQLNNFTGGQIGETNQTNDRWITYMSRSCDQSHLILCVTNK